MPLKDLIEEGRALQNVSPRFERTLSMLDGTIGAGDAAFQRYFGPELRKARAFDALVTRCNGVIPVRRFLVGGRKEQWAIIVPRLSQSSLWYEAMVLSQKDWKRSQRCSTAADALEFLVGEGYQSLADPEDAEKLSCFLNDWGPSRLEKQGQAALPAPPKTHLESAHALTC